MEELRLHKDRSGLSLAALAAKTNYSTTSWHRYLAGRKLPPWEAVDALGRLAQADRGRLRALWESAVNAWRTKESGASQTSQAQTSRASRAPETSLAPEALRTGEDTGPAPRQPTAPGSPHPDPHLRRVPRFLRALRSRVPAARSTRAALLVTVAGCLTLATLLLVLLRPWDGGPSVSAAVPPGAPSGAPAWPWPLRSASRTPPGSSCQGDGCRGHDPYRAGCDRGSAPVHELSAYGHTLTLWYSAACRTVWTEISPGRGTARLTVYTTAGSRLAAPDGESRTGMLAADPGTARGSVAVATHQLGVSAHTSWITDRRTG